MSSDLALLALLSLSFYILAARFFLSRPLLYLISLLTDAVLSTSILRN